jgi:hypothetical protein
MTEGLSQSLVIFSGGLRALLESSRRAAIRLTERRAEMAVAGEPQIRCQSGQIIVTRD